MDPQKIIGHKVTPLRQLYFKWRSLRNVPFRKKFFIGYDLDGNTFWEFRNYNDPARMRRIVEYRIPNLNYVDYKIPPQWVQWLRHNRPTSPTLEELLADFQRQQQLKGLVQQAEERWKSIPLKDWSKEEQKTTEQKAQPAFQQPTRFTGKRDDYQPEGWTPSAAKPRQDQPTKDEKKDSFQPQSWSPSASKPSQKEDQGFQPSSWNPANSPKR